mmetsp:Transcript_25475/g.79409  ORF Transcript_25475/g.79409 Transcript_25475/m.79409 type:complete len:261 (+) Transcript_25475:45-827(+)
MAHRGLAAALALAGAARLARASESGPDLVGLFQHSVQAAGYRQLAADAPIVKGPPPTYLVGDGAEVFIETGKYADLWVPASVLKETAAGWYTVRVPAGDKKRNYTDVTGIRFNYMRQVTPEDYDASLASFLARNDTATLAVQVDREAKRRKRASENLKKARDFAKEAFVKGCPGEYIHLDGNQPGPDEFGKGRRVLRPSVDGCAKDCDSEKLCKAFEWDPISTICLTRRQGEPKPDYTNYQFMFCQKFVFDSPANKSASP